MPEGLDVIILDDDVNICEIVSKMVKRFYTWGEIITFSDVDEAISYCLGRDIGIAIFIVDVFLGGKSGFYFLDSIDKKFPTAYEDTIIMTGNASDDIVNMCVASDVNHLLEKPIKSYTLQLAIRSIVTKYLNFSKKLLQDPAFANSVAKI